MTEELKLCPFCGAGHTLVMDNNMWRGGMSNTPQSYWTVEHWCPQRGNNPNRLLERIGHDREAAIAAWNTRADSEEVAKLRAVADAAKSVVSWNASDGDLLVLSSEYLISKLADALRDMEK